MQIPAVFVLYTCVRAQTLLLKSDHFPKTFPWVPSVAPRSCPLPQMPPFPPSLGAGLCRSPSAADLPWGWGRVKRLHATPRAPVWTSHSQGGGFSLFWDVKQNAGQDLLMCSPITAVNTTMGALKVYLQSECILIWRSISYPPPLLQISFGI